MFVGAVAGGLAGAPAGISGIAPAIVLAGAAGALRSPRTAIAVVVLAVAASGFGTARLATIDEPSERVRGLGFLRAQAIQLEHPRAGRFGVRAAVEVVSGPARGARLLAQSRAGGGFSQPGRILAVAGEVRRAAAPQGGFDMRAYLRRRGLAALLDVHAVSVTRARRGGVAGALDSARERAQRGVSAGRRGDRAALARGMVLGQDEAIAEPVRDDFRASGLAHLLAVSGQNVMLLCALAWPLVALSGLRAAGRVAVLVALIALYVPIAGAGPSLQRAGIMGAAALVPLALGRGASGAYALGLAAAATLAVNPRVSGDPGWQLSFAAVAGILALRSLRERARIEHPVGAAVAAGTAITLVATLATAPLLAFHFGAVSLASLPANVLALPAVAPVMWAGMLQAALAQLAAGPLEAPALAGAGVLGAVSELPLAYIAWLARTFADQPFAQVSVPQRSGWVLAAGALALPALALALPRLTAALEPRVRLLRVSWRAMRPAARLGAVLAPSAAGALLLLLAFAPPAPPRAFTVSFLDVGQGDATLVQDPSGAAVLFDGGRPEARVVRLLRRAGVRRLAMAVATHQSADHHGGLREVIERVPVGVLLENGAGTRDPTFHALLREARRRGVRVIAGRAGQRFRLGATVVRVIGPRPLPPGAPAPADPNERALVTLVSRHGFDLLLTADAESPSLAGLSLPRVEAFKVPHHGSADPGLPGLLARVRPSIAAIEVGAGNPYRHPRPETLSALRRAVPQVYRTDRDGTIRVTVEGGSARVSTGR